MPVKASRSSAKVWAERTQRQLSAGTQDATRFTANLVDIAPLHGQVRPPGGEARVLAGQRLDVGGQAEDRHPGVPASMAGAKSTAVICASASGAQQAGAIAGTAAGVEDAGRFGIGGEFGQQVSPTCRCSTAASS
jgi:hypothetical protein